MYKKGTREIAYAGIVAALYAVLTIALAPISYGIYQIRLAEALTVLPFLFPSAAIGLWAGCLVANIFGGNGLYDILFGPLFTLAAGSLTYMFSRLKSRRLGMVLAPIPPIIINAFGVAAYLAEITQMNYLFVVQMIGVGQIVACYVLGLPLLFYLNARGFPRWKESGSITS